MKKFKWLSLFTALTILAQLCLFSVPVASAEATDAPVDYAQNFTNAESLNALTNITVSGAGEAALVTEAGGNVALKASGVKNLTFNTGATTSNKVEISYKFKVIQSTATGYGDQVFFGTVRNNTTHAIRAIHYNSDLNFYTGKSNTNKFSMVSAAGDNIYHSIRYVLDFDIGKYMLYIDGVLTKDWGGDDWDFYTAGVSSVNNLYFMTKATDEVYLDDIIIKDIVPPTSWDFEESTSLSDYAGLTVSGTSAIVDDGAGNHFLKAGNNSSVIFNFPKTESDRVQVKFKLKSDAELTETSYEQGDFGAMYNGSSLAIRSTLSNGKGMTQYPITGANVDNPGGRRQKITTAGPDAFQEIIYDIDFKNQTYIPTVDGALIEHWGYRHFEIINNNHTVNTLKFTPRSNVIYLDDLEIIELPSASSDWNFEENSTLPIDGLFAMGNNTTIVEEADGNRALFVSGPTTLRFRSPDTTTQKAMVSYKIKILSAATNLSNTSWQFGAARNDVSSAVHAARYQTGLLGWHGTGNTNRTMLAFNSAVGDGNYHTIKYVMDFESHTYSVYADDKLLNEFTDVALRDSTVDSINQLYFYTQTGDTFYLDDVKIKEMKPAGEWDFETSDSVSDFDGVTTSGNAEIVKDSSSGNVLKLTGAGTLQFDVSSTVSNQVEVRYKIKGDLISQSGVYPFGSVRTGSTETVKIGKYQNLITNYNGSGNNKYLTLAELADWKEVRLLLDMDNHTYRTWVNTTLKPYHENGQNYDKNFYDSTKSSVDNIYFNLQAGNTLYIDDVAIRDITLNAVETTLTDVDPKGSIDVTLSSAVAHESLRNENFELYAGETAVTDFTVIQSADGVLSFTTPSGFAYNTTYTVKILDTINTETSGYARAKEDLIVTATTLPTPDVAPAVKETYPKNEAETGLIHPVITFENPIAAGSAHITVTDESGAAVSGVTLTEAGTNCAYPTVTVSIPGMTFGKTYTVTVNSASGAGASAKPLAASKTFSFSTREIVAENITVIANGTDGKIKVGAMLISNTEETLPYVYLAALYKGNTMIAADSSSGTLSANGKTQEAIYLPMPSDFGTDYTVKLFAWNSFNTLAPYMRTKAVTEVAPTDDYTYWTKEDMAAWKAGYDAKITDKGIDGFTIGAITDVQTDEHNGFRSLLHHYGLLTNAVNLIGGADCVADLGDMLSGNNLNKSNALLKLAKQSSIMQETGSPVFRVIGNHDNNQGGAVAAKNGDVYITESDWTKACDADWSNVMDSSTAGIEPYYYKDFEKDKIRVIAMNTSDVPWEYTGQTEQYFSFGFGPKQLTWLAEEALDFSSKGDDKANWGVVFMMHVGVYDGSNIFNYSGFSQIVTAFQNGTAGIINKTNSRTDMSIFGLEYDFTEQGAMETICTIDGHTHYDDAEIWNNMQKITITSSNRVSGSKDDVAIDIITIDRTNRKIYANRLGQGADREWDY